MELKTVQRPAFTVVGLLIHTQPMSPEIPALWPRFVARMPEIAGRAEPDVSYGVMRHDDGPMHALDYMAGVSVAAGGPIPQGMESLAIPAGTYAVFSYPLSGLAAGFGEIFERLLPASRYMQVPGPYFERYGESFDPGDTASLVEICLPVGLRQAVAGRGCCAG